MKAVLITGGNKGIGFEMARDLADRGYRVIVSCRSEEKGMAAVEDMKRHKCSLEYVVLEVTDRASVKKAAAVVAGMVGTVASGGGLDLLINNAGISGNETVGGETVKARQVLNTNYYGLKNTFEEFVPLVREFGLVIHLGSGLGASGFSRLTGLKKDFFRKGEFTEADINQLVEDFINDAAAGIVPTGGTAIYNFSKTAVMLLTEDHQKRLIAGKFGAAKGIVVVSVCPGWCATDLGGHNATKTASAGAKEILHAMMTIPREKMLGKFISSGQLAEWK